MKLSDHRIRKLPAKDALVRDGDSPLAVRVSPRGAKTYMAVWRANGKLRRARIAKVGEMSLEDARERALELFSDQKKNGGTLPPAKDTVADYFARYQAESGGRPAPWGRARSAEVERVWRMHLEPVFGHYPLDAVPHHVVDDWWKKQLARGKPQAAASALGVLRAFFGWRPVALVVPVNPTVGIAKPPKGKRSKVLSLEELAAYNRALDDDNDKVAADGCRLLVLTGLRLSEVVTLRWDQIDEEKGLIRFDAKQMKSGRTFVKNLCADALAIVQRQPRTHERVFAPYQRPTPKRNRVNPHRKQARTYRTERSGFDHVSRAAFKKAGIEGASAHHVHRHGYKSYGRALGIDEDYLHAMQDHETKGMLGTYSHLDAGMVRDREEKLQSYLADALYERVRDNVVPLAASQ